MSNKQDNRYGYIYRKADLTEQGLRDLIGQYLFPTPQSQALAFAANSVELERLLVLCSSVNDVNFSGKQYSSSSSDVNVCNHCCFPVAENKQCPCMNQVGLLYPYKFEFGHVFTDSVEIRWKYADESYDALVLTESKRSELDNNILLDSVSWLVSPEPIWQHIHVITPNEEKSKIKGWRLGYVEYRHHINKVVQFVRYTQREEVANNAR